MKGALVTFIAKVEGVVKEKFSGAPPQTPTFFPPNKNSWPRHWGEIDILICKKWPSAYDLHLKLALLEKWLENPDI